MKAAELRGMRGWGTANLRCRALVIAAAVLLMLAASARASAATNVQVAPAGAVFPQRALTISGSGIPGLTGGRVHVVENGSPVRALTVRSLSRPKANDFGVVLVIDISPTQRAIEQAVLAARGLASQRPNEEQLGIVEADATPPIALPLTRNGNSIQSALSTVPIITHHGLDLYHATLTGVQMLQSAKIAAGSVIVLSDGADRGDADVLRQIEAIGATRHIRIFAVGIPSPRFNTRSLTDLAQVSGGQFVRAGSKELSQVFGAIQTKLASQYLIQYYSGQPAGKRVAASVTIDGIPGAFDISYFSPALPPGVVTSPIPRKDRSIWTSTLGAVIVSVGCALLIALALGLVLRQRDDVRARIRAFVTPGLVMPEDSRQRTLAQRALGDLDIRRRDRPHWLDELALELDIARVNVSLPRLAALTLAGTVVLGWLLVNATSSGLAAVAALAVPIAVRMGIGWLANRQRREFEEQLPDNLQVIASALRAGHTFVGSLGVMVEDAPEPSRREFKRALADEQLGIPLVDALERISARMHSSDFQQVTLVATLQRDTGGNTAEVIDVVTETVRERLDLRRLIRSLTAQGRLAGSLLTGLPVALLIAISFINPGYTRPLFHQTAGIAAFVAAIVMIVCGYVVIRRIVDIEV